MGGRESSGASAENVLARRFNGWRINQAWVADITTAEVWPYLAP
jgi:hypothetical protein